MMPEIVSPSKDFDHKITGIHMEAYCGARSEVRARHLIVEVMYLDFKSQYSLVNGLLCNQDLLLATGFKIIRDDPDCIRFIEEMITADLFVRDTWPHLRGIVRIDPAGCVLPVHTSYHEGQPSTLNVSLAKIIKGPPVWVSVLDLMASKMKTGFCPKILNYIEIVPVGRQETKVIRLNEEDPLSEVDLNSGRQIFSSRLSTSALG